MVKVNIRVFDKFNLDTIKQNINRVMVPAIVASALIMNVIALNPISLLMYLSIFFTIVLLLESGLVQGCRVQGHGLFSVNEISPGWRLIYKSRLFRTLILSLFISGRGPGL